ncbi:MBL fold metallo-hydrolase [Nocardia terpenica]|uniref:MBL fold metallo-hydrolase n=1 Tax=Nocardia terpenica TaxID=455432 RepID=UPI00189434EA|nr:MBL fold metallo-hydrolase [Nocardia terpenica]MBF6063329.1 MBL fold metallo-hydrolase [Nocardia terpenica]MBF6105885.1 MBL fold metallo-hydrolase [Nocardia terpenica]MBF6113531.1 MBL fold metallo-hydrolase [Nocardia terpenica]MBF6119626.1 MBL fold metallo-hydrolase [Nocardia terpenica]MBF6152037.1 MBL fold metallo-hydrolase [Nocardia terpenica]
MTSYTVDRNVPWPVPIWDADAVRLISRDLGSGAYAVVADTAEEQTTQGIPQPTSGGFLVGADAVLVVESMMTPGLADQLLSLVAAATDKPIRFVGITSDHGDHFFGNYRMPRSARIIQHENAFRAIEQTGIEPRKQAQIGWFDLEKGIEQVRYRPPDLLVPPGGKLTVNLGGGKFVEALDLGQGQTPGDVWYHDPEAKVIYAGNAFIAEKPAIPWLLDGVAERPAATLRRIFEWLPADTRIVPGHGRVTDKEGMRFFVEYTEQLVERVRRAVAAGMSLEQTRKTVTMREFDAGYPLFEWLHFGVNIPCAYHEAEQSRAA